MNDGHEGENVYGLETLFPRLMRAVIERFTWIFDGDLHSF
jgi:hypothetical protein